MEKLGRFYKIMLLFTLIGLSIGGVTYLLGIQSILTEEIYFTASDPNDWTSENSSILLHGKIYYPFQFQSDNTYPTIVMFHGVGRTLEDHYWFAQKMASLGCICLTLDFRGHGLSNGTFPLNDGARYNESFGDALGAYRYIINHPNIDHNRLIGYGVSLGGGSTLFLALNDLIPTFVVWYPATAYFWNTTELYKYTSTNPLFHGLILAGTADECSRCLPEFTIHFVENNPEIDLLWLEGATHTDSRFYSECFDQSVSWISADLGLNSLNLVQDWYLSGWMSLGLTVGVIIVDGVMIIINKMLKKTKKGQS